MFKVEECSFYLGVLFGHLSAQIIFHKTTKPSILSQLKTMEERLELLMSEVELGIFSSPHEVHKLAEAFHDDVKKLAASCKDCECQWLLWRILSFWTNKRILQKLICFLYKFFISFN